LLVPMLLGSRDGPCEVGINVPLSEDLFSPIGQIISGERELPLKDSDPQFTQVTIEGLDPKRSVRLRLSSNLP
jgi:hypothetical protein